MEHALEALEVCMPGRFGVDHMQVDMDHYADRPHAEPIAARVAQATVLDETNRIRLMVINPPHAERGLSECDGARYALFIVPCRPKPSTLLFVLCIHDDIAYPVDIVNLQLRVNR